MHLVVHIGRKDTTYKQPARVEFCHERESDIVAKEIVHPHCLIGSVSPVMVWILSPVAALDKVEESSHIRAFDPDGSKCVVLAEDPES